MRKKILVADDYDPIRELIKDSLKEKFPDHDVEEYKTGDSLSKRLEQDVNGIALVVTDNQMPGCNGLEIIKYYARDTLKEIPFILFYGLDNGGLGKEAVKNGAFGYALKPNMKSLFELVQKALGSEE